MRLRIVLAVAFIVAALPAFATPKSDKFVAAAAGLQNPLVVYDPSYRRIAYPGGDVPAGVGICADVVVRAYRAIGIDLQKLVHEDMKRHFSAYPRTWHMTHTDANIDHRRVLNLATFFRRHGTTLKITGDGKDYVPGDIVTWNLNPKGSVPHIGIVTSRKSFDGRRPLLMHNVGGGQVMEDVLFAYAITGHFRYGLD